MTGNKTAAVLAAILLLLRLLLPGAARQLASALREALVGELGWESVEALGRSVAQSPG